MGRQRGGANEHARVLVSEQFFARCMELAEGSKLRARMLFERAAEAAMQAEMRRLAAQARAGNSRLMDSRRRWGMSWR